MVFKKVMPGRVVARWKLVKKMGERMLGTGLVRFTTLDEIVEHVIQCRRNGPGNPRVDHLPYYAALVAPKRTRAI